MNYSVLSNTIITRRSDSAINKGAAYDRLVCYLRARLRRTIFFVFYVVFVIFFLYLRRSRLRVSLRLFLLQGFLFCVNVNDGRLLNYFKCHFYRFIVFLLNNFCRRNVIRISSVTIETVINNGNLCVRLFLQVLGLIFCIIRGSPIT